MKLDDLGGKPLLFSETLKLDSQKSALMWATNHPIFFSTGVIIIRHQAKLHALV